MENGRQPYNSIESESSFLPRVTWAWQKRVARIGESESSFLPRVTFANEYSTAV